MENKNQLNDMMRSAMDKVRAMVDTNTIVGQPITTPDGVTLIPISKVSFGFGSGGGDYGKPAKDGFGGGAAAVCVHQHCRRSRRTDGSCLYRSQHQNQQQCRQITYHTTITSFVQWW